MGKKKESEWEKEELSLSEIWFEEYKKKTEHLCEWEKQCLEFLREPVEQAIKKVLSNMTFKSFIDIEELMAALIYEELIFFIPIVTKNCKKIREEVHSILNNLEIQKPGLKETI